MSSSSFIIPSENIGDSAGSSTSASFRLNDTLGEMINPFDGGTSSYKSTSSSYALDSGFQTQLEPPVFTFSVGSSSLTLSPAPSDTTVSTAATTVTTSTNAPFGYSTTIVDDGMLRAGADNIDDIADGNGTVGPVGTEEYGVALTGADRAFTDERATVALPRTTPPTPRTIASNSTFGAGRTTTVTFKMTMASSTLNGSYSHIVTFISTPRY